MEKVEDTFPIELTRNHRTQSHVKQIRAEKKGREESVFRKQSEWKNKLCSM